MTDRLRLAAQEVLDTLDRHLDYPMRLAYALRPVKDALRRALAEPAEEPGVPTVDECERIAFKAGVEAALRWSWPDTDDAGIADMVRMVGSK